MTGILKETASMAPTIIKPDGGEFFDFGGLGVDWKLDGRESDGRFSIVHHPIAPRALAAPLHYHHNEDEYSYVLAGTLGALLGEDVVTAGPGTWVKKPRRQWHTFWNAGDTPARILELISPGGFEQAFRDLDELGGELTPEAVAIIGERYSVDIDFEGTGPIVERHGLSM